MSATMLVGFAAAVATAAAIYDLKWRRIPNWLCATALVCGMLANVWLAGVPGLLTSLTGAGLGLALLLPFYMLRAMGAGDVKLLMAIGALVGPQTLVWVALFGGVVGGIMSLVLLTASGRLLPMLRGALVLGTLPPPSGLKAPYGLAIASGVYLTFLFGPIG